MESLLTYERLYSDTAGESHFAHLQLGLSTRHFAPPAPPSGVSELTPVSRCGFLRVPAGFVGDLPPSPLHMWIFFLNGEMKFEASDSERRRYAPGNALLLEDTTGRGHRSRVLGPTVMHGFFQRGGLHG